MIYSSYINLTCTAEFSFWSKIAPWQLFLRRDQLTPRHSLGDDNDEDPVRKAFWTNHSNLAAILCKIRIFQDKGGVWRVRW